MNKVNDPRRLTEEIAPSAEKLLNQRPKHKEYDLSHNPYTKANLANFKKSHDNKKSD